VKRWWKKPARRRSKRSFIVGAPPAPCGHCRVDAQVATIVSNAVSLHAMVPRWSALNCAGAVR
jgi:hypothetical protein